MSQIIFQKDISRHPLHYFMLLSVQMVGLWGLFWFSYQQQIQFIILVSMAISYVAWGIVHHAQHKDLHIRILFEYILVAVLAILVFGSLLFRA